MCDSGFYLLRFLPLFLSLSLSLFFFLSFSLFSFCVPALKHSLGLHFAKLIAWYRTTRGMKLELLDCIT